MQVDESGDGVKRTGLAATPVDPRERIETPRTVSGLPKFIAGRDSGEARGGPEVPEVAVELVYHKTTPGSFAPRSRVRMCPVFLGLRTFFSSIGMVGGSDLG
jgi:hypothetical protein